MLDFAIFAVTFLLALVAAVLYLYPVTASRLQGSGRRPQRGVPVSTLFRPRWVSGRGLGARSGTGACGAGPASSQALGRAGPGVGVLRACPRILVTGQVSSTLGDSLAGTLSPPNFIFWLCLGGNSGARHSLLSRGIFQRVRVCACPRLCMPLDGLSLTWALPSVPGPPASLFSLLASVTLGGWLLKPGRNRL